LRENWQRNIREFEAALRVRKLLTRDTARRIALDVSKLPVQAALLSHLSCVMIYLCLVRSFKCAHVCLLRFALLRAG
jgi:hypothetical protein